MALYRRIPDALAPLQKAWGRRQAFLAAFGMTVMQTTTALAQASTGGAAGDGGKSYGIPYLVIVLVVALGLFITLRPAGRSVEIKRDPRAEL